MLADTLEDKVKPTLLRRRLKDEREYWLKEQKGTVPFFQEYA